MIEPLYASSQAAPLYLSPRPPVGQAVTRAYWRQLYARYWGETAAWVPPPPPESLGELGEEARKLLENPVLHEALGRIETKLVSSWRSSAVGDEEAREAAYRLHWAVEQLKAELRLMIANASMQGRQ